MSEQFLYPRRGVREVLDPFEKTVWLEEVTDFGCAPMVPPAGYQPPEGYRLKDAPLNGNLDILNETP